MYTREQASQLRQQFWTTFGQYMSPVASAEGLRVNWVNYKTGVRNISFRMDADNKRATIGIELDHSDAELQELFFDQFAAYQAILQGSVGEDWDRVKHTYDEHGKLVSRIYTELTGVSVYNKEDWPALISFFKPRIIGLDDFWSSVKPAFEG